VDNWGLEKGFSNRKDLVRGFVKNNLPDLIGFYPILNDDALSGLWFRNRLKNCLFMRKTPKTLKGLYHLG
jgi:hypothetical protein